MSQLHPAVGTGLMWAVVHQALVLCILASAWAAPLLFPVVSTLLFLDLPTIIIAGLSRLTLRHLPIWGALPQLPPHLGWGEDGLATFVSLLVLGPLQWFLIGLVVGSLRNRREPPKSAS